MAMINFLSETKEMMAGLGLSPEDIRFIGSKSLDYECTWEEFCCLADVEYDNTDNMSIAPSVAYDLTIQFRDRGYLYRSGWDGFECWGHVAPCIKESSPVKKIKRLVNPFESADSKSIAELNSD